MKCKWRAIKHLYKKNNNIGSYYRYQLQWSYFGIFWEDYGSSWESEEDIDRFAKEVIGELNWVKYYDA